MKLEIPNGVTLYLWEDEVEAINLQDSHIDIVRPSGKILKISLSEFWLKNTSRNVISGSSAPQMLPSSNYNDKTLALPLSLNNSLDITLKSLQNSLSLQTMIEDLKNAVEKINKNSRRGSDNY